MTRRASAPTVRRRPTLVEEEQQVEVAEQRLQDHEAEERRTALRELYEQPGGQDLWYAVLTGLDPTWRDHRDRVAVRHIDAALDAASSDSDRLGRLRNVLADPNEAARYRAALAERGDRFTVEDIDAAIEAVLRWREEEANRRQREEEEKRERKAKARRTARLGALSPAGRELHAAWLASLSPAVRRASDPAGADVDRALDAMASDARLPRLEAAVGDDEQLSYYRAVLGAAGDAVTLQQVDEALEATETFVGRKQAIFEYPGNSEHPAGGVLYRVAVESQAPGWRPGAEIVSAAVFSNALADVESQLVARVRQAADEFERLVPTTQPHPRTRPDYRVPSLSDALVDQHAAARGDVFIQATVAEVRERYARRARHGAHGAGRLRSEGAAQIGTGASGRHRRDDVGP